MSQPILEAALKPSAAQSYPYLPVRMWTTASRLADLVATHRQRCARVPPHLAWKRPGLPIQWTRVLERNADAMNPEPLPGHVGLDTPPGKVLSVSAGPADPSSAGCRDVEGGRPLAASSEPTPSRISTDVSGWFPWSSFSAYRLVFFLFWTLSPVALATAPTAPVTALTAFPLTVLAVAPSPDELRLFEPRFFELELRFELADLERFLAEDFEPLEAAPPAFLALRVGISPPQGACERDEIADPAGKLTSCHSAGWS